MKAKAVTTLLFAVSLLAACGSDAFGDSDSDGSSTHDNTGSGGTGTVAVSPAGTLIPDGARQLAAQCFQCHGTDGRNDAFESLAGESERELISEMHEMRNEKGGIMHYQARGYSDAQIRAIAAYIASLPGGGSHDDD
ncbi:MAG: c-type cytochrome [Thiothrix sp.]|nr:c-type cytochrome [Thiothrix sp.]HPE60966.1 c-type cytochrome [Thiolinea sp.]